MNIPVTDIDIFYISYDEPGADARYAALAANSPRRVQRVHGVKGFHAAHLACARMASTDRFITVDGDNHVVDDFFERSIDDTGMKDVVFSFRARNLTNGLEYGNGGVKIWPRKLILNHPTHEEATEESGRTDFCWRYRYMQVDALASHVFSADNPMQAFRSGYREGVKMTLVEGAKLDTWANTISRIHRPNLSRLSVWLTIGADAPNGWWSIYGARQGLVDTWLDGKPVLDLITDYDAFRDYFMAGPAASSPVASARALADRINDHMATPDFSIVEFDASRSMWFKRVFINPSRAGLMIPDMEPLTLDD